MNDIQRISRVPLERESSRVKDVAKVMIINVLKTVNMLISIKM